MLRRTPLGRAAPLVLSGVLAAFTGVLLAGRTTSGDPTSGTDMELTAIAAVILGGRLTVSSGSLMTTPGIICGWKMIFF